MQTCWQCWQNKNLLKKFINSFLRNRKKVFGPLSSIVNFQFHNFLSSLRILLCLKLVLIFFVNKLSFEKTTTTSSWIVFIEKKIFRNLKIFISEHLRILKMLSVLRNFWLQKYFKAFFQIKDCKRNNGYNSFRQDRPKSLSEMILTSCAE